MDSQEDIAKQIIWTLVINYLPKCTNYCIYKVLHDIERPQIY